MRLGPSALHCRTAGSMGFSVYGCMAAVEAFLKDYKIEHFQMGLQV